MKTPVARQDSGNETATAREARQAFVLDVIHRINGFLGVGLLGVPHKSKATTAASVSILNNHLWGYENKSLALDKYHFVTRHRITSFGLDADYRQAGATR